MDSKNLIQISLLSTCQLFHFIDFKDFGWNLNYGAIALMWRGGCIIRSVFLGNIKDAYKKSPNLKNLLMDDFFKVNLCCV